MARNPSKAPTPSNVDEEYNKTLRSRSFVDMWAKVHRQLRWTVSTITSSPRNDNDEDEDEDVDTDEREQLTNSRRFNLPEFVLDPSQEAVLEATAIFDDNCSASRQVQSLLIEYFNLTLEACIACEDILVSIHRARAHYGSIRLVLVKLSGNHVWDDSDEFDELAGRVDQNNPISLQNLAQFSNVQSSSGLLLEQLKTAYRKIIRRLRFIRMAKKAARVAAIGTCTIAAVAGLVIAVQTAVGNRAVAAAAPVTVGKKPRWAKAIREDSVMRLAARVDAAAKGAYIMRKDFETMSQMVRQAHDEVEHERGVAKLVLRINREPLLKAEAAREVEGDAAAVAEQLHELEQHVHLCLITINRSRRLVAQAMAGGGQEADDVPPAVVATA